MSMDIKYINYNISEMNSIKKYIQIISRQIRVFVFQLRIGASDFTGDLNQSSPYFLGTSWNVR
jgi:hypothetical protein